MLRVEPPAKSRRSTLCSADLQIGVNSVEGWQDAELELGATRIEAPILAVGWVCCVLFALLPACAGASAMDLPSHHEIDNRAVEIAVFEIDITITRSDEHTPSLDIRAIDPDRTTSVEMTVTERDGVLFISSPRETTIRPGVALELTLAPEVPLRIAGSGLRIERMAEASGNADPSAAPPGRLSTPCRRPTTSRPAL